MSNQDDNTPELKPCPFCGSERVNDSIIYYWPPEPGGEITHYYWACPCCTATGATKKTKKEATESWNRRA